MINFACPKCNYVYKVAEEFGGRITKCRACGQQLHVPVFSSKTEVPQVLLPAGQQADTDPSNENPALRKKAKQARWHYASAVLCFFIGIAIVVLGLIGAALGPGETHRHNMKGTVLILCVLALPFLSVGSRLWYKAERLSILDARTVMAKDERPPVLYLRSFGDDASGLEFPRWRWEAVLAPSKLLEGRSQTHEETLAKTLQSVGPIVAIGRPGESMPELGAHRMYVTDERWQE